MACYYYIKLPNGGEVRIPADSVIITEQIGKVYNELTSEINKHYSEEQEFTGDSELYKLLKNINSEFNFNTLKSVVNNSTKDTLIENINKKIQEDPKILDLITALRKDVLFKEETVDYRGPQSKDYGKIPISEFLEKLNAPIGKRYLDSINTKGLINVNSASNIIRNIESKIENVKDLGISYEALTFLKDLLNKIY
jgi:hypothetical protein